MSGERSAEEILTALGEKQLQKDADKAVKFKDLQAILKGVAGMLRDEVVAPLEARIASLEERLARYEADEP